MRILLIGATGQLGRHLSPYLKRRGELISAEHMPQRRGANQVTLDLTRLQTISQCLDELQPNIIVNSAAFTAVDEAESKTELAWQINAKAPEVLADWARLHDARLIHFSTDYVFDGCAGRPYQETDTPKPISVYGASKLAGENAVLETCPASIVLRTSWLYSGLPGNFFSTISHRLLDEETLRVVDDQFGCPTWAGHLALAVDAVVRQLSQGDDATNPGLYHYADSQAVTWYDFAQMIAGEWISAGRLGQQPDINATDTSTLHQAAKRPGYSVLSTRKFVSNFGMEAADLLSGITKARKDFEQFQ